MASGGVGRAVAGQGGRRRHRESGGDAGENFGGLTAYLSRAPPGFGNFSKCWSIYSARICRGG